MNFIPKNCKSTLLKSMFIGYLWLKYLTKNKFPRTNAIIESMIAERH